MYILNNFLNNFKKQDERHYEYLIRQITKYFHSR
jgi:hypothetical protein